MNNLTPIETIPLLEHSPPSTRSHEEVAVDSQFSSVNISPQITDQVVFGCIAIATIWSVSGLLKQFRLLIEVLDRETR